jgi:protein ImuA
VTLPARPLLRDPKALEELLRDGQVRRAPALSPRAPLPLRTGVAALDAALGGGIARGQLHELIGPPGAGGTALLRAALAAATSAGELCALIDPADSFDPSAAGIDLERLLWVRPRDPVQALRAAEIALEARFALVALDLGDVEKRPPPPGASPWARLSRRAEKHGGALLLLARSPLAGTFAATTVELERARTQWEGRPGAPGRFLRGAQAVGAVARHKRMPPSAPLPLSLPLRPK